MVSNHIRTFKKVAGLGFVFGTGILVGAMALDNVRLREERDALQTVVDYVSGGLSVDGMGSMPEDGEAVD